ncbi:MAG: protein kinase [Deltaproteobacteria bacterium]|nr:protein kinase [Deltaproteobacteria bacterium]
MKRCPKCGAEYADNVQFCPVDGATLVAASSVQPAGSVYKVAGRFSLGDLVERRPVGDIYAATDDQTGKSVWVLFVGPQVLQGSGRRDQALRELKQTASVRSDVLVPVVDSGVVEDGRVYVVTESIAMSTLAAHVGTHGPLPVNQAVASLVKIATALKMLQSQGLAHRDMSPSNVFVDGAGNAKLLDLGVATCLGGNVCGDPWFMSPEQAEGRPVDPKGNIYSLGALFYYAVAGAPPFTDQDPKMLVQRHRTDNPVPPTKLRSDLGLSIAVDEFVGRAMSKSPLARFFSFDEVTTALQKLAPGFSVGSVASQPAGVAAVGAVSANSPAPAAAAPTPAAAASVSTPSAQPYPVGGAPAGKHSGAQDATSSETPLAKGGGAAAARRRRKKGSFRATMWFMKGEKMQMDPGEASEDELAKVTAGDGSISDTEKELEERYRDDGSITAEDRAKFSLRTGRTGMMQAVSIPDKPAPVMRPIGHKEAVQSLDKGRKVGVWFSVVGVIVIIAAFAAYFVWSSIPKTNVSKAVLDDLQQVIPDFEPPPPVIVRPTLPAYPQGETKALWAALVAKGVKPLFPGAVPGAGEYLVSFERKLAFEAKAKAVKGKHHRRRRKVSPFVNVVGRKKAIEAEKQYQDLRKKIIGGLVAALDRTKGKVYVGGDASMWKQAYRAGRILGDLAVPPKGVEAKMARLLNFFAPAPPAPRTVPPQVPAFDKVQVGMAQGAATGLFHCVEVKRVVVKGIATVTCRLASSLVVTLVVSEKTKKIIGAGIVGKNGTCPKTLGQFHCPAAKPAARVDARPATRPRPRK